MYPLYSLSISNFSLWSGSFTNMFWEWVTFKDWHFEGTLKIKCQLVSVCGHFFRTPIHPSSIVLYLAIQLGM